MPTDALEHLQRAHRANNKQIQRNGDEHETAAWEAYCRAQGGMGIGREAAIKLAMRAQRSGPLWRCHAAAAFWG
ncbi:hypothetical protein ACG04R_18105 [Roseateles sp. BYS78W]|uniref:Uncharacterized protein n=1 Tax=Pelomonas candidula TaxID=3299025 RepID=A0ABW7HFI7_9BURK